MIESVRQALPSIKALVVLGDGVGGIRVSASNRAEVKENILKALEISRRRSNQETGTCP
jgi:ribosomal protein S5